VETNRLDTRSAVSLLLEFPEVLLGFSDLDTELDTLTVHLIQHSLTLPGTLAGLGGVRGVGILLKLHEIFIKFDARLLGDVVFKCEVVDPRLNVSDPEGELVQTIG